MVIRFPENQVNDGGYARDMMLAMRTHAGNPLVI